MSSLTGVKGGRRHISWRLPQLDEELNTCISENLGKTPEVSSSARSLRDVHNYFTSKTCFLNLKTRRKQEEIWWTNARSSNSGVALLNFIPKISLSTGMNHALSVHRWFSPDVIAVMLVHRTKE